MNKFLLLLFISVLALAISRDYQRRLRQKTVLVAVVPLYDEHILAFVDTGTIRAVRDTLNDSTLLDLTDNGISIVSREVPKKYLDLIDELGADFDRKMMENVPYVPTTIKLTYHHASVMSSYRRAAVIEIAGDSIWIKEVDPGVVLPLYELPYGDEEVRPDDSPEEDRKPEIIT